MLRRTGARYFYPSCPIVSIVRIRRLPTILYRPSPPTALTLPSSTPYHFQKLRHVNEQIPDSTGVTPKSARFQSISSSRRSLASIPSPQPKMARSTRMNRSASHRVTNPRTRMVCADGAHLGVGTHSTNIGTAHTSTPAMKAEVMVHGPAARGGHARTCSSSLPVSPNPGVFGV